MMMLRTKEENDGLYSERERVDCIVDDERDDGKDRDATHTGGVKRK